MKISLIFNENIKMKIVLICILKLIFVSYVSGDAGGTGVSGDPECPTTFCFVVGQLQNNITNYQFSVTDLPERCQAIIYGNYLFDSNTSSPLLDEDISAIQCMVDANKTVYVYIAYDIESSWEELFDPEDHMEEIYTAKKKEMISTLKDLSISGVVFGVVFDTIYNNETGYADKISKFINEVKEEMPSLRFGLPILGIDVYNAISSGAPPDFTITNEVIDFYHASVFADGYLCDFLPPPSAGENITMELLCQTLNQSGIDMTKTAGTWEIGVQNPEAIATYSDLCTDPSADWCAADSERLYNTGSTIRSYFPWLEVRYIDFDDVICTCGCRKFPATNAVFDGWEQQPKVECPTLDRT